MTLANAQVPQALAPVAVIADLDLALATIEREHPDPTHSFQLAELRAHAAAVAGKITSPLDQAGAWSALARLNPVLADGHLAILLPRWRQRTRAHLDGGEGYFPFEVAIDRDGSLRVRAALGGGPTPHAGRIITAIDGHPASTLLGDLMMRMHGDTARFRAALLAQRWWLYYEALHGTAPVFAIEFAEVPGRREYISASHQLPAVLRAEDDFSRQFACEVRAKGGVLTLASFASPAPERVHHFLKECFERLIAERVPQLVIDIRENGGGDDALWRDGILPYLTDQPYRHGSGFVKRVLNPGPGEHAGQVVAGTINAAPPPTRPGRQRYSGNVLVLIGPQTYSSAVLFANVIQDHRPGRLAGEGSAVRARQSGGVRSLTLPNTGLVLSYPRFVLERPAGAGASPWLQPDLLLDDNMADSRQAVDAVLNLANDGAR